MSKRNLPKEEPESMNSSDNIKKRKVTTIPIFGNEEVGPLINFPNNSLEEPECSKNIKRKLFDPVNQCLSPKRRFLGQSTDKLEEPSSGSKSLKRKSSDQILDCTSPKLHCLSENDDYVVENLVLEFERKYKMAEAEENKNDDLSDSGHVAYDSENESCIDENVPDVITSNQTSIHFKILNLDKFAETLTHETNCIQHESSGKSTNVSVHSNPFYLKKGTHIMAKHSKPEPTPKKKLFRSFKELLSSDSDTDSDSSVHCPEDSIYRTKKIAKKCYEPNLEESPLRVDNNNINDERDASLLPSCASTLGTQLKDVKKKDMKKNILFNFIDPSYRGNKSYDSDSDE